MKLKFEADLDFQLQAIASVCDLFQGQEHCRSEFTVTRPSANSAQTRVQWDLGVGNRLTLLEDELLANLNAIQVRNGLPPSSTLPSRDFSVEMETGTGKTYVYLRTIFELNKRYGFTKFIIVVPSVAIKEGVYKSLQIMDAHFKGLYSNVNFTYFPYDSTKLGEVRNFASSGSIQIMVVTVGAINKKDVNNLYKDSEKTGGEKPIDLIRATHPIVIVDEPQSVDGGLEGRGKEALDAMNPLCTLRYSATHVNKHQMVFRLDAVDAYERKLVKRIEVASPVIEDAHNKPYVRLVSTQNKRGVITATVELDVETLAGPKRKEVAVRDGDDLEQTTKRALYRDMRIGEINVGKDSEAMVLHVPGGEHYLVKGEAWGGVEPLAIQRHMIQRTIKEHLDKELRLRPRGIKVLSLFFIDAVEKYRRYDAEGNPAKGVYATIFEEEYRKLTKNPKYHTLFEDVDLRHDAADVHEGYFSIDRKKVGGKTVEVYKDTRGDTKADDETYNLIMRNKEKLLSLGTPLKFIFSHSALREGWDNPNVFQICTLRDILSEQQRRQTIGRGLRLCVNQDGERVRGPEVNTLTVIATESVQEFAEKLQKEIEADTGIRFGLVEKHQFAAIAVTLPDGTTDPLGLEHSVVIWEHLKSHGYLDSKGKVQDALRTSINDGTLTLPESAELHRGPITEILRKLSGKLEVKNADERRMIPARQAVLHSPDFKALWDSIKLKTTYRVEFDDETLIEACTQALRKAPPIASTRIQWQTAELAIGKAGVEAADQKTSNPITLHEGDIELPDILTELQDRTQLTRRSIYRILAGSERLDDFKRNPQRFISLAAEVINRAKQHALIDGIKYQRLGADHYYAQELFEKEELSGYLKNLVLDTRKSVYEHLVYDSDTEAMFARQLEQNDAVRVYAKLPGWFKIQTPLGGYNPDWAVLIEDEEGERLYFVVETKSSLFEEKLRDSERAKIACGKAHFKALNEGSENARYVVATTVNDLFA